MGRKRVDKEKGVLFGVDYYPEQWDRSLWESDFRRMREMGFRSVRMMEFAWVLLEPRPGKFDFTLFDEAVDLAAANDLTVVLGTPTATFPAWLYKKDPGMVQVHPFGIYRDFGTRRQACYNSDTFRKAAARIVEAVARRYGKHPAVIGWQIDNEIGHEGSDRCVCPTCIRRWPEWLRKKYRNVRAMNDEWGTVFWGTCYDRFEQVPVPRKQVSSIQSPGLALDYDRFCSDSAVEFVDMQMKILRRHIRKDQWVTTNLYPTPQYPVIDMECLCRDMEMVAFDNYPVWGDQDEPLPYYFTAYILSYIRGLNDRGRYAVFEQFSGFQGHTCLGYLPPDEQVTLWTNQAVAHGADHIYYFRWRTAPFGQEQLCYGLFDPDNTPTSRAAAIAANMRRHRTSFERFASLPFESQACVVYDKDNARVLKEQYLSKGIYMTPTPFMQVGYDLEAARHFVPYSVFNVNADVKSARSVDLSRYRIISLPLYQMADPDFVGRLEEWVREGGTLVLGWRAGARDMKNHAVDMELPGLFAGIAGVRIKRFESLNATKVGIRVGIVPSKGEAWADIVEPVTAKPIAWYRDRRKHYSGEPCVTVNEYGRGRVYYFGTSPDPLAIFLLFRKILKQAGVKPRFKGMGLEVVRRTTGNGGTMDMVLNHTASHRWYGFSRIEPYGVRFFERKGG